MDTDLVLPNLIRKRAATDTDRLFLENVNGSTMTYGQLQDRADHWSGALTALGVTSGSTVIAMIPTGFEAVAVWMGIAQLRAIEVPVNTAYVGRMLEYIVLDSLADVLIVDHRYVERLGDVPEATSGKTVIVTDGPAVKLPGSTHVATAADVFAPLDVTALDVPQPHDIATIMYTSGTTGPSKGVLVTWAHAYASAIGCLPAADFSRDDVWYGPYPLFHVSGKAPIYALAYFNGRVMLRETFNTNDYWDDIDRHGCTCTLLMGSTAVFLEQLPQRDDDSDHPLDKVLMSPLPDDADRFASRFGLRVRTVFNMTEISCPIQSTWDLVDGRSCGRVVDGYQCRVVDENDYLVPPGQLGEPVVRSDDPWVLMAGYWNMADKTAEAWRNLWFHTGDGFTYDDDGNFYFVDRRKDAIRRRGENISSMEVEAEINTHPDVMECAVIAVPSEWGEDEVMALIVARPACGLDPRLLYDFLASRMAKFMMPRYLRFVEELPKTPTAKVRKVALRDEGITTDTWDRDLAIGSRRRK